MENESTARPDYSQYVHEWTNDQGERRYSVGEWDQERGQFIAPLNKSTAKLTGCSAKFSRREAGMDTYRRKTQAYARARYLFGTMNRN